MERKSFLKSLLTLIVAPSIVKGINTGGVKEKREFYATSGFGSRSIYGQPNTHRTLYSFNYNHKTNKGEYTAYLNDGRKITFPIHEYNPEKWRSDYGYLSDIN